MAKIFNEKPDQYLTLEWTDTPRDANFWISGACNFSCVYCLHGSKKDDPAREGLKKEMLSWERFKKMADDLAKFPQGVVSASFCGIGEPTLHPLLPEMVSYLKTHRLVKIIELTTNGSRLTKELALRLVGAGVDALTVSIQGTKKEDYERVCGNPIDPKEIAENVKYFYQHSCGAKVHVRTLDLAVPQKEQQEEFYSLFGDICDHITIAHTIRMFQGMDYTGVVDQEVDQYTGEMVKHAPFCPLVFSTLHLFPDGGISCCPLPVGPPLLGNIDKDSLPDVWNSKRRLELILSHAQNRRDEIAACKNCREPDMMVGETTLSPALEEEIRRHLTSKL